MEQRSPAPAAANPSYVTAGETIIEVRSDREPASAARYDAAEDRWVLLDPPPSAPSSADNVVWTGREVIVVAGAAPFLRAKPDAPAGRRSMSRQATGGCCPKRTDRGLRPAHQDGGRVDRD